MKSQFNLPEPFVEYMSAKLGDSYTDFYDSLYQQAPVSLRWNLGKKILHPIFHQFEPVPWCNEGIYIPERISFTLEPTFHSGGFYVQESSSMFVEKLMDFENSNLILDLCAAPGGKSTLIASRLKSHQFLISNEVIKSRLTTLRQNITRWGNHQVAVTNLDPDTWVKKIENTNIRFDTIIVDAPCSGEGLWRKNPEAISEWSTNHILLCSARQKRILEAAGKLLAPGGRIIYSTCTYNQEENINNILHFLENHPEFYSLKFNFSSYGVEEEERKIVTGYAYGYQCYPHKIKGEGFFFSVLVHDGTTKNKKSNFSHKSDRKNKITGKIGKSIPDEVGKYIQNEKLSNFIFEEKKINESKYIFAFPHHIHPVINEIESYVTFLQSGLMMGELGTKGFVPTEDLALSIHINETIESVEFTKIEALKYLKLETFTPEQIPEKSAQNNIFLAKYNGLGLGWFKWINGNRMNNYYPKNWRILMDFNTILDE